MTGWLRVRGQKQRLTDRNSDQFLPFVVMIVFNIFLLYFLEHLLARAGRITRSEYLLLLLCNPVLAAGIAAVTRLGIDRAGGVAHAFLAIGGDPHRHEHSEIETLITQQRFVEAADCLRDIIDQHPDDVTARILLAGLLAEHLGDAAGAGQSYLAARRHDAGGTRNTFLTNALIDLHRATGNREALKNELARFARDHRHGAAGRQARAELRALVAQDDPGR